MKSIMGVIMMLAAFFVFTGYSLADPDLLRSEVARQLVEKSPWNKADVEVDDIQITGPDISKLNYDQVAVRVPSRMQNIGKVTVLATLYSGGRELKNVWVSARIKVYREGVVALNSLRMNDRITKEDIKVMRLETRDLSDTLTSEKEAVGMLVRRPIAAGSVIKKDYVRPEVVVKRGDRVIISVENERLRVKSVGTAGEDGSRGDTISARMSSGKEITGKVTGPGELMVDF